MGLVTEQNFNMAVTALGPRCEILRAAIAQLYFADPDPNQWNYTNHMGVTLLVKDRIRKSYFIRLVSLALEKTVWEQEIYNEMTYKSARPFFHTFAADKCMVGLNFADEEEAGAFYGIVQEYIAKQNMAGASRTPSAVENTAPNGATAASGTPPAGANAAVKGGGWFGGARKEKPQSRKKGRLTSRDISMPSNFEHRTHIGFDKEKGLSFDVDTIPPEWLQLFSKAGVTKEQLQNPDDRKFIFDFVQQNQRNMDAKAKPTHLSHPSSAPPAAVPAAPVRNTPPLPPSRKPPPPPPQRNSGFAQAGPPTRGSGMPFPPPPVRAAAFAPHPGTVAKSVPVQPTPPQFMTSVPVAAPMRLSGIGSAPPPPRPSVGSLPPPAPTTGFVPPPPPPTFGTGPPPPPPAGDVSTPPLPSLDSVPPPPPPSFDSATPPSFDSAPPAPSFGSIPPPPPSFGSIPPPPPPPMPSAGGVPPPPPGIPPPSATNKGPAIGAGRGDLLAAIRAGGKLKKVEDEPLPSSPPKEESMDGLAGALSRALKDRNAAMLVDTSEEEDDEESEWSD